MFVLALLAQSAAGHIPPYSRAQWRHWVGRCYDTREQVLLEERVGAVSEKNCAILSGNWTDPYSGEAYTDPRMLDVDHVVPLKWAHEHGGWAWGAAQKQAFANDITDPDHLVAVGRETNRSKGDKGPDRWLPPRRESWCWYGHAWDRIVRRWKLSLNGDEWDAITRLLLECAPLPEGK